MIFTKRLDHDLRDQLRSHRIVLLVSLLSLIGFLFVSLSKSSFTTLDAKVNYWATSIQTSSFMPIAEIIDFVFDTPALLTITLLAFAFLFYKGYRNNSALLVGAMSGDAAMLAIIKMAVHSARPLNELMYVSGFSFPSGHASGSVVFCGLLTCFAWQHWKSSKVKISSSVLSVIVISIVGFDRIYLNVHWFSDVLGGYLLGIFWLTFSILMFLYLEQTRKSRSAHSS